MVTEMNVFVSAVPGPVDEGSGASHAGGPAGRQTRVAVILVSAHLLSPRCDVTVLEAGDRVGGHTVTTEVPDRERPLNVDAGFIVFNDNNYPNFVRLLAELGVETHATSMSFSVTSDRSGIEYAGTNLNTLFAQRGSWRRSCVSTGRPGAHSPTARSRRSARWAISYRPTG